MKDKEKKELKEKLSKERERLKRFTEGEEGGVNVMNAISIPDRIPLLIFQSPHQNGQSV